MVQPLQTVDSRFEDERQRFLDLQEMLKSFQRGVQAWLKEIKVYGVYMTCGVHGTCLCVQYIGMCCMFCLSWFNLYVISPHVVIGVPRCVQFDATVRLCRNT